MGNIWKEEWGELAMEKPELKKAMTTLELLSQDKEARLLYESRQKALLDERSRLHSAKMEGKMEGFYSVAKKCWPKAWTLQPSWK
ncbi:PD-(D/E)XK nuclease family transposase [Desmospora activa]|uniref:PD-(D/E)XK nuclease family transposase n=1 Tax=Desmospora activa TaxID=500615 RepID=UPI000D325D2D|nr:PD-(D/E)XK nuclease family transposase [Desmospora activa]